MKTFFTIAILTTPFFAISQCEDTVYLIHIGAQMRRLQPRGTMYYGDRPNKHTIDEIISVAPSSFKRLELNGLILNNAEKYYILSSLRKTTSHTHKDSLFEGSRRLRNDTLVRFVEHNFMRAIDSIKHVPDSILTPYEKLKAIRQWAFCFSEPIYLRKKTILIYYFMYYISSGGAEGVEVYKLEKERWHWVGAIGGGAW